jgi:hypothetical protein
LLKNTARNDSKIDEVIDAGLSEKSLTSTQNNAEMIPKQMKSSTLGAFENC